MLEEHEDRFHMPLRRESQDQQEGPRVSVEVRSMWKQRSVFYECRVTEAMNKHESEKSQSNAISELSQQVASMRNQLHEIKELVCMLTTQHGCAEHRMMPSPNLFGGGEERITLENAVSMVWSKSAAKDPESLSIHAGFLKNWATVGLNSAVLETDVVDGVWYTSAEAVERFQTKLGLRD